MKIIEHLYNAVSSPPDDGDAASFTGGCLALIMSPFFGWVLNVATAVLVAFLSRLMWEFAKPFIEWLTQKTKIKSFTDVRFDEKDIYKDDPGK